MLREQTADFDDRQDKTPYSPLSLLPFSVNCECGQRKDVAKHHSYSHLFFGGEERLSIQFSVTELHSHNSTFSEITYIFFA